VIRTAFDFTFARYLRPKDLHWVQACCDITEKNRTLLLILYYFFLVRPGAIAWLVYLMIKRQAPSSGMLFPSWRWNTNPWQLSQPASPGCRDSDCETLILNRFFLKFHQEISHIAPEARISSAQFCAVVFCFPFRNILRTGPHWLMIS
jgi:hypothetical protein